MLLVGEIVRGSEGSPVAELPKEDCAFEYVWRVCLWVCVEA